MSCPISKANLFDCATLKSNGLQAVAVALNWEDILNATITTGLTGVITDITLPVGKLGYKYTFPKGSTVMPSSPLRSVARGVDTFDHTLDIIAQNITQEYRNELSKMRFQPTVWLVARKDGVWEMYGRNVGMKMSAFNYAPGAAETAGTMPFTVSTPDDEQGEISLPVEIFITDAATTQALIDGLLIAQV